MTHMAEASVWLSHSMCWLQRKASEEETAQAHTVHLAPEDASTLDALAEKVGDLFERHIILVKMWLSACEQHKYPANASFVTRCHNLLLRAFLGRAQSTS